MSQNAIETRCDRDDGVALHQHGPVGTYEEEAVRQRVWTDGAGENGGRRVGPERDEAKSPRAVTPGDSTGSARAESTLAVEQHDVRFCGDLRVHHPQGARPAGWTPGCLVV